MKKKKKVCVVRGRARAGERREIELSKKKDGREKGAGCRMQGVGCRVLGVGCWV